MSICVRTETFDWLTRLLVCCIMYRYKQGDTNGWQGEIGLPHSNDTGS
jgi:hypothetical protein